jgi:hypothetical protein
MFPLGFISGAMLVLALAIPSTSTPATPAEYEQGRADCAALGGLQRIERVLWVAKPNVVEAVCTSATVIRKAKP